MRFSDGDCCEIACAPPPAARRQSSNHAGSYGCRAIVKALGKVMVFLQKAGFTDCYRLGYGRSLFEPFRDASVFDTTHPTISLFFEAIKSSHTTT
jgi:hypothetical protein